MRGKVIRGRNLIPKKLEKVVSMSRGKSNEEVKESSCVKEVTSEVACG